MTWRRRSTRRIALPWDIALIEYSIMARVLEKMSKAERQAVLHVARRAGGDEGNYHELFQATFLAGGRDSQELMKLVRDALVENVLGRGLQVAANVIGARVLAALLGPIGWAVSAFAAVIQIAGPSYKVTLPCVANVAYIRGRLKEEAGA